MRIFLTITKPEKAKRKRHKANKVFLTLLKADKAQRKRHTAHKVFLTITKPENRHFGTKEFLDKFKSWKSDPKSCQARTVFDTTDRGKAHEY